MPHAVKSGAEGRLTLARGELLVDETKGEQYRALDLIGRGGMGEVYRGIRVADGGRCAIKCVRSDLVKNPAVILRTRFEAVAFRKISHPNVVHVRGTGVRRDGVPWMCMDWLEGFTLEQINKKTGKIPIRFAVEIVRDLCRGLQAIHEFAIHRDIKPANIHLGLDAVTRALDLGIAKPKEANVHLTSTGFQVGTLPFMAPEQLDNTVAIDHRADLWAAVVVFYMLITGVHPFAKKDGVPEGQIKLGYRIIEDPHRPLLEALPSAPSYFSQIIDRGLAKDPEHRHRSAKELVMVLTAALARLEADTGHAEPLSSLVDMLRGESELMIAQPPQLSLLPSRRTDPMPPLADWIPEQVKVIWTPTRTTLPMSAPSREPAHDEPASSPLSVSLASEERASPPPREFPAPAGPVDSGPRFAADRESSVPEEAAGTKERASLPGDAPEALAPSVTPLDKADPPQGARGRLLPAAIVLGFAAAIVAMGLGVVRLLLPSSDVRPRPVVLAASIAAPSSPPSAQLPPAAPCVSPSVSPPPSALPRPSAVPPKQAASVIPGRPATPSSVARPAPPPPTPPRAAALGDIF
jgi:serine/threonine-protein kinase